MTEFLKNNISKKICPSIRTVLFNCYQILVPHLFCIQFKIFTMNTHREKSCKMILGELKPTINREVNNILVIYYNMSHTSLQMFWIHKNEVLVLLVFCPIANCLLQLCNQQIRKKMKIKKDPELIRLSMYFF